MNNLSIGDRVKITTNLQSYELAGWDINGRIGIITDIPYEGLYEVGVPFEDREDNPTFFLKDQELRVVTNKTTETNPY